MWIRYQRFGLQLQTGQQHVPAEYADVQALQVQVFDVLAQVPVEQRRDDTLEHGSRTWFADAKRPPSRIRKRLYPGHSLHICERLYDVFLRVFRKTDRE